VVLLEVGNPIVVFCFVARLPSLPIIVLVALFSLFSSSKCCECECADNDTDVMLLVSSCIGSVREGISLSIDVSAVEHKER